MSLTGSEMDAASCIWNKLTAKEPWNEPCTMPCTVVYVAGPAMACISLYIWRDQEFQMKQKAYEESYNFFNIFLYIMHLRVFLPKLCHMIALYAKPDYISCEGCAFVETFLDVLEIETLTHVCIDKYVVAKYLTKGWPINKQHYDLYMGLCFFFSFLYSIPPVFGLGNYGLDFDCKTCTFDMVLPEGGTRYIILAIWLLRSVKPVVFMLLMLYWTRKLEGRFTNQMKIKSDPNFTRVIETVVFICLITWAPFAVIRGYVVLSQVIYGEIMLLPIDFTRLAPIFQAFLPLLVTVTIPTMYDGLPRFGSVVATKED